MATDTNFESKMSSIVENELNAKLPTMKNFHVGFQLLEKNDDETKAIGVNAFLVNGVLVYNPVFFLNGQFKGMDLLYIVDKDMFVPAMDNWLVAIKDETKNILSIGKSVSPSKKYRNFSSADIPLEEVLFSATSAPITKVAAAQSFITKGQYERMTNRQVKDDLSLQDTLMLLPKEAQVCFCNTMRTNADFANAVFQFYKPEDIQQFAMSFKEAADTAKAAPVEKTEEEVQVISKMDDPKAAQLDPKEKELFLHNGVFVKDKRARHSVVFKHDFKEGVIENPTHDGVYDVLMSNGSFKPFVIFTNIKSARYGGGNAPGKDVCTCHHMPCKCCTSAAGGSLDDNQMRGRNCAVIPYGEPTKYFIKPITELFTRPSQNYVEYEKPRNGVGTVATKASFMRLMKDKTNYFNHVLLVQKDYRAYEVSIQDNGTVTIDGDYRSPKSLLFTGKPGKMTAANTVLTIPEDIKAFGQMDYKEANKFIFGNVDTIQRILRTEAGLGEVQVFNRSGEVTVRSDKGHKTMDKVAALKHLTMVEGIRGNQAVEILKEAARAPSQMKRYFIKYASEYDVENAPGVRNEINQHSETNPIETYDRQNGKAVMPNQFVQEAVKASQTGSRQVFDTSVLNNLIRSADISQLRKDFLKDMIKGMDKVGRLLFVFYWHMDEFEERYGKDELKDLEEKLKQVFKETGDLILFLKEKMALGGDNPENLNGTLSEDISDTQDAE